MNANNGTITVMINSEKKVIQANSTLFDIISAYNINTSKVAIDIDGTLIPKSQHGTFKLTDGMNVEIVTFVGGG